MSLTVAASFGSLSEASIAFSSLESAGFKPVAGFNMNTPGIADGMAPSAYRVLVPEDEIQAARQFLSELKLALASAADDATESTAQDEDRVSPGQTTLGRIRRLVRYFAAAAVLIWVVMTGLALLRR